MYPDGELFAAISAAARPTLTEFYPQDLANTAWSLATLTMKDMPFLNAIAASALPLLSEFRPQNLTNIAWAFAVLEV